MSVKKRTLSKNELKNRKRRETVELVYYFMILNIFSKFRTSAFVMRVRFIPDCTVSHHTAHSYWRHSRSDPAQSDCHGFPSLCVVLDHEYRAIVVDHVSFLDERRCLGEWSSFFITSTFKLAFELYKSFVYILTFLFYSGMIAISKLTTI